MQNGSASKTMCFFDTKVAAHRLMIICGLCGIKCAELHGNLTQTQRLEALEAFREGSVDVLLCTGECPTHQFLCNSAFYKPI